MSKINNSKPRIYIDSADIDEINTINNTGIISGITTNPSLILKSLSIHKPHTYKHAYKHTYIELVNEFINSIPSNLDIHIELTTKSLPESIIQVDDFTTILSTTIKKCNKEKCYYGDIYVKIPVLYTDIINSISKHITLTDSFHIQKNYWRTHINATLVFTESQALLASYAGASYISIFIGRLDDESMKGTSNNNGISTLKNIVELFKSLNIETRIIAASIRNESHVIESIKAGADIVTVPFNILKSMTSHHLTSYGIKRFDEDYSELLFYNQ